MESSIPFLFLYGMLSFLSPCFFPLFPSYLAHVVRSRKKVGGIILGALVCTSGIMTSFVIYGLLFWILFAPLSQYGLLLHLIFGFCILFLGISTLTPLKKVFSSIRYPKYFLELKSLGGTFLLGFFYVLIAAPCALPIFLSALFLTATIEGITYAILGLVTFALGAGVPLVISSFLIAKSKEYIMRIYCNFSPMFETVSAFLLIFTGLLMVLQII